MESKRIIDRVVQELIDGVEQEFIDRLVQKLVEQGFLDAAECIKNLKNELKVPTTEEQKVYCSSCKQIKPISEFHKHAGNKRRFFTQYNCKDCQNRITNEYKKTQKAKEKAKPEEKKTKVCGCCGQEKPVSDFGSHFRSGDGLQPWCNECHRRHAIEGYAKQKAKEALRKEEEAIIKRLGEIRKQRGETPHTIDSYYKLNKESQREGVSA